jgi:hypothetical protein
MLRLLGGIMTPALVALFSTRVDLTCEAIWLATRFAATTAEATGQSPKLRDWPAEQLPAHKNVRYDSKAGRVIADGFSDRFKVQVWGEPSSTITSHHFKGWPITSSIPTLDSAGA